MRTSMFASLGLLILAILILSACAAPAPSPVVVKETVVVPGTPQVVQQTVVVPGATQVVQQTVVVPGTPVVKERPKLRMWIDHYFFSPASDGLWKAQALEFAQQNGFDLEYLQDSPDVMQPKEDAAMESKTLPDILYADVATCAKVRRSGQALEVTDVVAALNKNMGGIIPGFLAAVTLDGKQYSVPFAMATEEFYVRKDVLAKTGMKYPETWEDALALGVKANNPPSIWGWGLQFGNNYDTENQLNAMLWGYGGSVWGKDGKTITLDSPETRQVLALIKKGWDGGIEPKDTLTGDESWNNGVYQTGKVAMIQNTGSVAKWIAANDKDLLTNTQLGKPPAGPKGAFISGTFVTFCLAGNSKNPDLAKGLVKYLSSPEKYQPFMNELQGFRVPIYLGLDKLKVWDDPMNKPLKDNLALTVANGYPGPVTDAALETYKQKVLAGMVVRVLNDNWTADQAIKEAVDKINKIVAQVSK